MPSAGGLHVTVWGEGDPAVLVHGSLGTGEEHWREQRPLAARHRLLIVDRRGYGKSPPGPSDFERDAADVAALLPERAHVLGLSYGGVASVLAAALRPDAIRSLTVIEPPALGLVRGRPEVERFIERVTEATREASDGSDYAQRFRAAFGIPGGGPPLEGSDLASATASWHERPPWEAEIPLDELANAPFPKLVVRGAWDDVPPEARERGGRVFASVCDVLVERLGAESAEFPGAAHNAQLLGPPFNERLSAFWESAR